MKHTIILFAFFISLNALAQKQEEGNVTLELEFAPLGSEPLKINSLRTRYFYKDNKALRLSVYAGGKRSSTSSMTPDSSAQLVNSTGNFDFTLRPGVEHHFDVAKKLSPYLGGEFFYGYNVNRTINESPNSSNSIMTMKNMTAKSSFGLNAISGADFYFSDKVYLGIELGFGFIFEGKGKTKTKYENQDGASGLQNSISKGTTTNINWGPNYQGTIRLGYCIK